MTNNTAGSSSGPDFDSGNDGPSPASMPERIWASKELRMWLSMEGPEGTFTTEYIRADLMGWVPVSERLPTEEDAIDGEIVVLSDVGLEVIRYEYIANKQNKWGITHWMPLPPLPGDSDG